MKRILIAASAAIFAQIAMAQAADPLDGDYHGTVSAGRCHGVMNVTVAGTAANGLVQIGPINGPFRGEIAADGTFTGKFRNGREIQGKFAGAEFSGSYHADNSQCGGLFNMSAKRG